MLLVNILTRFNHLYDNHNHTRYLNVSRWRCTPRMLDLQHPEEEVQRGEAQLLSMHQPQD
jgi:hypothetical protein